LVFTVWSLGKYIDEFIEFYSLNYLNEVCRELEIGIGFFKGDGLAYPACSSTIVSMWIINFGLLN